MATCALAELQQIANVAVRRSLECLSIGEATLFVQTCAACVTRPGILTRHTIHDASHALSMHAAAGATATSSGMPVAAWRPFNRTRPREFAVSTLLRTKLSGHDDGRE